MDYPNAWTFPVESRELPPLSQASDGNPGSIYPHPSGSTVGPTNVGTSALLTQLTVSGETSVRIQESESPSDMPRRYSHGLNEPSLLLHERQDSAQTTVAFLHPRSLSQHHYPSSRRPSLTHDGLPYPLRFHGDTAGQMVPWGFPGRYGYYPSPSPAADMDYFNDVYTPVRGYPSLLPESEIYHRHATRTPPAYGMHYGSAVYSTPSTVNVPWEPDTPESMDTAAERPVPKLRRIAARENLRRPTETPAPDRSPMVVFQAWQNPIHPEFRPSGRSNRSGRGQIDHDVFEGLPVRQWRQTDTVIGPVPQAQPALPKDAWPEPPMPRDSQLLPEHSQQLLRAARAGRLYRPPTPPLEEEKEPGEEDEEAKEQHRGFVARKWSQVPRNLEEPEPEYLAKRRKGLPSQYSSIIGTNGTLAHTGPVRETKVKRADADGNVQILKVLVPEGQSIEGEVVEEDAAMAEAAPAEATPGTVVEGLGVVNAQGVVVASDLLQQTPPRRRPPPPRRKPKRGPGRGRKKVMFEPGAEGAANGESGQEGATQSGDPPIKIEGTPVTGDTPMADAGEETEEGEDGDDGDDDDEDRDNDELSPPPEDVPEPKTEPAGATSATPTPLPDRTTSQDPTAPPQEGDAPAAAQTETATAPPETAPEVPEGPATSLSNPQPASVVPAKRDRSSSPELPLAKDGPKESLEKEDLEPNPPLAQQDDKASEVELDLLGSLERQLDQEG
ncbi:uncharacterized protein K452DRAFT_355779 [Aplosporella prunicola CBS 121167]|uniref:Uncharacterized protein n=1 Tax=Aplosporella prunicola CBS 121167 TaxID=1176127 RepID=A0A6A6BQJ8_9PEZI|nr:uncharacterized protein K452DRAFT_355779 [Aplosporella prunicola CBS 121167]KAF2146389.1 hypothetical protein K452DRAFT_355779 [Aplosporella prunicola CBS 121167]